MYTTAADLTFDADGGGAHLDIYGIVSAAGTTPVARSGTIYYTNFTAVHATGTVDAELAIANL